MGSKASQLWRMANGSDEAVVGEKQSEEDVKEVGDDAGDVEEVAPVLDEDLAGYGVDARLLSFVNNEAYALATQSGLPAGAAQASGNSQAKSGSRCAHAAATVLLEEVLDELTKSAVASKLSLKREFSPEALYFAILRFLSVKKNMDHTIQFSKEVAGDNQASSQASTGTSGEVEEATELASGDVKVAPRLRNYLEFVFGRDFSENDDLLQQFLATALCERRKVS